MPASRYHLTTLGCPKNAVDSDTIEAALRADGLAPTDDLAAADLVVLNTCAFVEAAREESIETALALARERRPGARLVLTGCLAERYGAELAAALPEVDAVVGFAGAAAIGRSVPGDTPAGDTRAGEAVSLGMPRRRPVGVGDLLTLPRAVPDRPWAYLKVAEGCDRTCAFCAIPSFRGRQRSRTDESVLDEAATLVEGGVREVVLVAQDVAWYGRDQARPGALAGLMERLDTLSRLGLMRQRLLYLYPSEVRGPLLDALLGLPTAVPYFDLSLQHASGPLLRRMRRFGSGPRFLEMIGGIRGRRPDAAFRSSFIVGFPGETEDDHETLLEFLEEAALDWAGFFPFSREDDTPAASMDGGPPAEVVAERIGELEEVQERITRAQRHALLGSEVDVLVDEVDAASGTAVGRTHREAPEIDGVVVLSDREGAVSARRGAVVAATVVGVAGPDLDAEVVPVPDAVGLAGW